MKRMIAAALAFVGSIACSEAKSVGTAPLGRTNGRSTGEAPHVEMSALPRRAQAGDTVTFIAHLRGYDLTGSDFCLKPTWFIGGKRDGDVVAIPLADDPAQCRNHEFATPIKFTNPGVYAVKLELRTTGSRPRLADWGFMYVSIGAKQ